jgi:hypothetical protein
VVVVLLNQIISFFVLFFMLLLLIFRLRGHDFIILGGFRAIVMEEDGCPPW